MLQHPQNTRPRQSELVRVEPTDTIPQTGALTYKRSYIHLDFERSESSITLAKSDRSVHPIEYMKLV